MFLSIVQLLALKSAQPVLEYVFIKSQMEFSFSQTHYTGATSVNKLKAFTALILKSSAPQQSGNILPQLVFFYLIIAEHLEPR